MPSDSDGRWNNNSSTTNVYLDLRHRNKHGKAQQGVLFGYTVIWKLWYFGFVTFNLTKSINLARWCKEKKDKVFQTSQYYLHKIKLVLS